MTTTWTKETKNIVSDDFLLQEMGDYLLQENGGKIILSQSPGWDYEEKH